jgi:hypothetical protein
MLGVRKSSAAAMLAAAGVIGLLFACKSTPSGNNCGTGTAPPDLTGGYQLVSLQRGTTTLTPPTVTGSMQLTAARYTTTFVLPDTLNGTVVEVDSGSYEIIGSSCINQFSDTGKPQFSGSFSLNGTTFRISGGAGGQLVETIWTKTS